MREWEVGDCFKYFDVFIFVDHIDYETKEVRLTNAFGGSSIGKLHDVAALAGYGPETYQLLSKGEAYLARLLYG
jgi:hypothetical protein